MEKYLRKTVCDNLSRYTYSGKDEEFIEATEWKNGEGVDISTYSHGETNIISLGYDELTAINHLVEELKISRDKEFTKADE